MSFLAFKISLMITNEAATNPVSFTKHTYNILLMNAIALSMLLSDLIALKISPKYSSRSVDALVDYVFKRSSYKLL